jgi:SSS family solute:Na+ symporter
MVSLALLDQVVLVLYFAAVIAVGFLAGRSGKARSAADYLLAGRSLTLPTFVMTLVSTWYGGILGVGEFTYRFGLSNWVMQGLPYYLFSLLFALLLAGKIRATGLATIPDKLQGAYGRKTALLGSVLTFLLMTPAPYVLMLAVLLRLVTGWPLELCLVAGTAASTAYLWTGGLRSDIATDVLEFGVMFLGFAIILPFAASALGGVEFLSRHLPEQHLTWHGGHAVQFILVWFLIALWTFVDPAFHQRCYAARSARVARGGILVAILFWMLFDAMTVTAGLYARAALPGLESPLLAYPLLAETVLPPGAKGLFYAGMLATIMSTLNTMALVSATTLGRDIVWRWRGGSEEEGGRALTRWGLVVSAGLSILLALLVPSVVMLWYTIGTVVVPGLLIPLVTSYFPRLTAPPRFAFAAMLLGWGISLLWLAAGWSGGLGRSDKYPLGLEPMVPGLLISCLIWLAGVRRKALARPPAVGDGRGEGAGWRRGKIR